MMEISKDVYSVITGLASILSANAAPLQIYFKPLGNQRVCIPLYISQPLDRHKNYRVSSQGNFEEYRPVQISR